MGCLLMREHKQRKIQFSFSKVVSAPAYEGVSAYGNKPKSDWEVKRGFEKESISRAVRLRECPLVESWLYYYV